MAYTVSHFYKKVLEGSDKMGSDFFSLEYVFNRLETATYDFIGKTIKFVENTQEIRDDLLPLYKPYKIPVITDPNDFNFKAITLPSDYLNILSLMVEDSEVKVRETSLIRHGQYEIYLNDPDSKPEAEYPIVLLYDSLARIISPGNPIFVKGFYLKKPTMWSYNIKDDIETTIAINLPENSIDKIIKILINDIFVATGDQRAQLQYQNKVTFRERGK